MKPGDVNHVACGEIFKIQSGPLNCNAEKVLYLLKCKVCGEAPYVGQTKNFDRGSITIKANIKLSGKETEKFPRNISMISIVWMVILELMIRILLFSSNVRHISNRKREKTFGSTDLKLFTR